MTSYSISDIIGIIQIRDIELNYHQSMVYINESLRQYSHDIKKEIRQTNLNHGKNTKNIQIHMSLLIRLLITILCLYAVINHYLVLILK